jgi:hypothetical protein
LSEGKAKRSKPKRSPLRRVLRVLAIVIAVPIVLLALAVGALHLDVTQRRVKARVEQRVNERLHGKLTIGALHLSLFGDIVVRDVTLDDPEGKRVVTLSTFSVTPNWSDLLGGVLAVDRLALDGVKVDLVQYDDGTTNLKRSIKPRPEPPPEEPPEKPRERRIVARALHLGDVDVSFEKADGTRIAVSDFGFDANVDVIPARKTAHVSLPRVAAGVTIDKPKDGLSIELANFETGLDVDLTDGAGELKLRATKGTATITQRGAPKRSLPLELDGISIRIGEEGVDATLDKLAAGALALQSIEVHGRVEEGALQGEQRVQLVGLRIDAKKLEELAGKPVLKGDVSLETRIAGPPEKVVLSTVIKTSGALVELAGQVDATDAKHPRYDVKLVGADIDTRELLASPEARDIELGHVQLGVRGSGANLADADADVGLHVGPTRVGQHRIEGALIEARVHDGMLELDPLRVDAYGFTLVGKGNYDVLRRLVDLELKIEGDVGAALAQLRRAGVAVSSNLPPGALVIRDGNVKVHLRGAVDDKLTADLTLDRLALAGGHVDGSVHAVLRRNLAPREGEKAVNLEALDGAIELRNVGLKQALALRGRKLDGMSGAVSGKLTIANAPDNPAIGLDLTARVQPHDRGTLIKNEPTLVLVARGTAVDQKASVDVSLTSLPKGVNDKGVAIEKHEILRAELDAPVILGKEGRGIAPDRPLRLEVALPPRAVAAVWPHLPARLRTDPATGKPRAPPEGTVALRASLAGTASRPQGSFTLDVDVAALKPPAPAAKTPDKAGAKAGADKTVAKRQRLKIDGSLSTDAKGQVNVAANLHGWLDSKRDEALSGRVGVTLSRSPLLPGPKDLTWHTDLHVKDLALQDLPLPPERKLAGNVALDVELDGTRHDVTGKVTVAAKKVSVRGRGPIDSKLEVTIDGAQTKLAGNVDVAGTRVLDIDGSMARGGSGLLAAVRQPQGTLPERLGNPALDVTLAVPDHSPITYLTVEPRVAALPGTYGGGFKIDGTLGEPTAKGGIYYTNYTTADGKTGRVAIDLEAGTERITAKIGIGPKDQAPLVAIDAGVPRKALPLYVKARRCHGAAASQQALAPGAPASAAAPKTPTEPCPEDAKLPIAARIRASRVPMHSILPSFVVDKDKPIDGQLDWRLDGNVVLDPTPREILVDGEPVKLPPISPETTLDGELVMTGGIIPIPDSTRRYHDVSLRLSYSPKAIRLENLSLRESDMQRKNRRLDLRGSVSLEHFRPKDLSVQLTSDDWLIFGMKNRGADKLGLPDAPRGTLDADIRAKGRLDKRIKSVDVEVAALELLIPDRFDRAHQPEAVSLGDVVYLDEHEGEPGQLPQPPARVAARKAEAEAKANPPPPPDGSGLDVTIRIPKRIHVLQSPMNLYAVGNLKIQRRGSERNIQGKIQVVDGSLALGGRDHDFRQGHIVFDEKCPGGCLDLLFGRREPNTTLRDISQASGGDLVTIRLEGPLDARKTTLAGAGSPGTLFDLLSVHNVGRPRYLSQPDMPASSTTQYPQHGDLLLMSYLAVNAPHLLFLDKVAIWSDIYDARATHAYGRHQNYEAEGYNHNGTLRVRAVGQPHEAGRSEAEVQVDHLFVNSRQSAAGVGVGAGSRGGGGPGVFYEWSSKD